MKIKPGYQFSEEELEIVFRALMAQTKRYQMLAHDADQTCDSEFSVRCLNKAKQCEQLAVRVINHKPDGI